MATVSLAEPKQTIKQTKDIGDFLGKFGVVFQHWPVPAALKPLQPKAALDDAEKGELLKGYKKQLNVEAKERGYIQSDVIVLTPSTPNLPEILARFDKTHFHDDDEVRYIFAGEGIFGFEPPKAAPFTVTVTPGDYIIIPANTYHWFTLTDTHSIKAIRLFKDMSGWVPHYKNAMG